MRAFALIVAICAPALAGAQEFFTLRGHGGPIMDVAVSSSGRIATSSFDNSVGVWSGQSPNWLESHRAAVNAAVFIDDTTLVSGGDDNAVVLWDLASGASDRRTGHTAKVMALEVSPDGKWVASASWDSRIGLWPVAGGPARFLSGHQLGVNDIAFTADGSQLFSASTDGSIRIWDVETGQELQRLLSHGFGVNQLVLNEAAGWLAYGAVDGGTRIVDTVTGELLHDFTLERRPILAMATDPEMRQIAVGDGEGYIMVIDTTTWRITRDFRATAQGPVWALAFSPNGQNIHAGGLDDILYSWPVATMDTHSQMNTEARSFLEDPETLPNGERQFKRKCSICHALGEGSARRAGPTLYGLFGRPAGTVPDYTYSSILDGSDIVWSGETIDALFDIGPDHYIPGTKMPMQRIAKSQDRLDLIEYLRKATAPREN
ncbi:MAG: c-type cytochrome [Rhodobacteraceae bacterium]|nr:c-type cytochrome [Paracoccaceae bacterium]